MKDLHLARAIWKHFYPVLVTQINPAVVPRGRPRVYERRVFLGVCYLLWSGCSWRALPKQFGSRNTTHRYFLKWDKSDLFRELWRLTLLVLNENRLISDQMHIVDGSQVLVQHLPKTVAFISPKYRPKRAINFSLLIDAKGTPLSAALGTANEHASNLLSDTLKNSLHKSQDATRRHLLGDKGYIGARQEVTAMLNSLAGIFHPRKNQADRLAARSAKKLKNHRWKVERTIS